MIRSQVIVAAALTLAGMALAPNAYAAGSVSASYWTLSSSNPDTGGAITGVVTGLVKSTLGPDGLPVESTPGTFAGRQRGRRTPLVDTAAWPCHARNKLCLSVKPDTAVRHLCEFLPEWTGRRQRRRHRLHISNSVGHV